MAQNDDVMPWESENSPWKSKAQFLSYIRGCLRKAWTHHPVKLQVVKDRRIRIENPSPKGKKEIWGCQCELCGYTGPQKEFQVDHIIGAGSLRDIEDIQGFAERLFVVSEGDLRIVCKPCHEALTHADKQGISFEQAKAEKQAIALQKTKEDKAFIKDAGCVPESNATKRRAQIIDILTENS